MTPRSGQPAPGPGSGAASARRGDPDRFLIALFLPASVREMAFALIGFNHALARAVAIGRAGRGEEGHGHLAALIRLQWWRDVADGARPRHEVARPLGAAIDAGWVAPALLSAMIDACERELEGVADVSTWSAALDAGPGNLARLLGRLADPAEDARRDAWLGAAGAAYGAGLQLRHLDALTEAGNCPLPADLLAAHGVDARARVRLSAPARAAILAEGARLAAALRPDGAPPRNAASLHDVFARRDVARAARGIADPRPRGLGDRVAVLAASLRNRPP